jgi:hypothetical protein
MDRQMTDPFEAFLSVDFQSVRQLKSVWQTPSYDVYSLHGVVVSDLMRYFSLRTVDLDASPSGKVIVGDAGAGKTHLVGRLRQRVWERAGYFVLLDFAGVKDFWATTTLCFVTALDQQMPNGDTQCEGILKTIVSEVISDTALRDRLQRAIHEQAALSDTSAFIDLFLKTLTRRFRAQAIHADVVRAMLLRVFGDASPTAGCRGSICDPTASELSAS